MPSFNLHEIVNQIQGSHDDATAMKKEVRNRCRSVERYIDHLFDQYARILVIRLDLHFRVDSDLRSDLARCRRQLNRLLKNQHHNSLFDNQIGYIWRLELGAEMGWHYHCIFFFNGAQRQQDITIADLIGEYWRDVITAGQGTYWNCNRQKDRYELSDSLGIGMVHHSDARKRAKLLQAAHYLCKPDMNLWRALDEAGVSGRKFGRGEIASRSIRTVRMGRPRSLSAGF